MAMYLFLFAFVSVVGVLLSGVNTGNVNDQQSPNSPSSTQSTIEVPTKKIDLHLDLSNASSIVSNVSQVSVFITSNVNSTSATSSLLRNSSSKSNSSSQAQKVEVPATSNAQPNNPSVTSEKKLEVPKADEDVSLTTSTATITSSTSSVAMSTRTSTQKVLKTLPEQKSLESDIDKKTVEEEKGSKNVDGDETVKTLDYSTYESNKRIDNPKFQVKFDEGSSGGSSHFFIFACIGLSLCIGLYLIYQSRSKILGYIIEGKRPTRSRTRQSSHSRDRSNVAYKPLSNESSNASEANKGFIY